VLTWLSFQVPVYILAFCWERIPGYQVQAEVWLPDSVLS
jgi:hypothetical protein